MIGKIYYNFNVIMRTILIILLFMTVPKMNNAQERYGKIESKFITKFSFHQLTGGVILLKAAFNDIPDSLNFILDTGSGAISLDSSTAAEFKIPNFPSGLTVSGIAGVKEVNFSRNNKLHLPGLTLDSLDFFINDYDLLTSVYGVKIDGVIGYSFLSRYIIGINYDSLKISVYTQGSFQYPRGSTLLHPMFTTLPIQKLFIRDQRNMDANFYFDTGAGLCFLLSQRFLDDSSFMKKKRKPVTIQVQGLGGKKTMKLTIIKQVQIGPYKFRRVPTSILEDDHNILSYPFLAGLIGNDILRRFNVVLNYQHRIISIIPNSHYRDQFDYSYTGMNMYTVDDGYIIIDDIVEGAPADKAGLQNGDIVIGVDNDFSNNITTYKNKLQNVSEKINLVISRENKIRIIKIKVGKIY